MAYADYDFYSKTFHGDALTKENAEKWLDRASDELDEITFGRLTFAFPTVEAHAVKVRKAACAVAEALYYIDIQRQAASAQQAEDGGYRGAVSSITSGKESITFSTGSNGNIYSAAAASSEAQTELLRKTISKYLANIPDAKGVNLLYAGGGGHVP